MQVNIDDQMIHDSFFCSLPEFVGHYTEHCDLLEIEARVLWSGIRNTYEYVKVDMLRSTQFTDEEKLLIKRNLLMNPKDGIEILKKEEERRKKAELIINNPGIKNKGDKIVALNNLGCSEEEIAELYVLASPEYIREVFNNRIRK